MPSTRSDPLGTEVVVVGAGPAGLAAGIHLARARVPHVLFGLRPGGLLRSAGLVECYPGFPEGIAAEVLASRMVDQALALGVRLEQRSVQGLAWTGAGFRLEVDGGQWEAPAVILATGTVPRALEGVPVAGQAAGRVAHETAELPADLTGRRVLVSGAGDAAFDSALQLIGRGARVTVLMRGERPRAMALLVDRARSAGVEVLTGHRLIAIELREPALLARVEGTAGEVTGQQADWLLVCHGRDPAMALWHGLASSQARGPRQVESHFPGLFMAGDLVRGECRYAAVAVGDGLRCGRLAEAYLERYRGGPPQRTPGSP
jgi:thioredoxin reductase (NADPH)